MYTAYFFFSFEIVRLSRNDQVELFIGVNYAYELNNLFFVFDLMF